MKRLLVIVVLLFVVCLSQGQTQSSKLKEESRNTGLGFHFGTISGNGFSYRKYYNKSGLQVTLGGFTSGSKEINNSIYGNYNGASIITITENGRKTKLSSAINYVRTLDTNQVGRFYIVAGGSLLSSFIRQYEIDYQMVDWTHYTLIKDHPERKKWDSDYAYYFGFGLGFDFNLGQNFHCTVELPLTVDEESEIKMYIPQVGIYYFFK
ncbi:MAG: hypothetical protein M0R67_05215 [Candidatus Cloacimonas sp.]|nr:hypothetical protein [Candidatus Cloacimonas sp.]